MAEDRGTTVIYAYAPPGGVSFDSGFSSSVKQLPDVLQEMRFLPEGWVRSATPNGKNIWDAVAANEPLAVMDAVFAGLGGQSGDVIKGQLYEYATLQRALLYKYPDSGYEISDPQTVEPVLGVLKYTSQFPRLEDTGYDFFGNPTMPLAGVYYWLFGGGSRAK